MVTKIVIEKLRTVYIFLKSDILFVKFHIVKD